MPHLKGNRAKVMRTFHMHYPDGRVFAARAPDPSAAARVWHPYGRIVTIEDADGLVAVVVDPMKRRAIAVVARDNRRMWEIDFRQYERQAIGG